MLEAEKRSLTFFKHFFVFWKFYRKFCNAHCSVVIKTLLENDNVVDSPY